MEDNNIEWAYSQLEDTRFHTFLTGPAGSGKSTLIKRFIEEHKGETLVCASTGIAAVNIGGVTIHRLFSFPIVPIGYSQVKHLDPEKRPEDYARLKLFNATKYIVIDEISMVRADVMDQISWFLHKNFGANGLFGGKKIIMVGDIDQLPPVVSSDSDRAMIERRQYKSPYFFDAACWNPERYSKFVTIKLTKVWRQSDPTFINFLNDIKSNNISPLEMDRFNHRAVSKDKDNGGVLLCSTNKIANETNAFKLSQVAGDPIISIGDVSGDFPEGFMPAARTIELKPGCRIMTIVNDLSKVNPKFVNGSIGTFIERITDENGDRLMIRFDSDPETEIEVGKVVFENIDYAYDEATGRVKSKVIGRFCQFPVKLAYALTIHKSQGQSFDKIIIDLGARGAFAHGQTYVALSRCRSMEGIILRRPLDMSDFIYDKVVLDFNKRVEALA
jgi:ATP-dependent exoDNAse (exonuclease V) alpha subunit